MSSSAECTSITGFLVLSLILGILGIALIYTIVGIFVGMGLIIAAWVFFLISAMILLKVLVQGGFRKQTGWCKANIALCTVIMIILVVFAAVGGVEHQKQTQPPSPLPSNESTTAPETSTG